VSARDRPKPPLEAVEAALETLADELMRAHPEWIVHVHIPGRRRPAGAVTLPALLEDDVEAILGRPARERRRHDDPVDQ
jgi:hypothetical protein